MKKRIILASTVALSLAPTLATQAEEIVWSPSSVEQIRYPKYGPLYKRCGLVLNGIC